MKEWTIPLILGLVAAGAVWGLMQWERDEADSQRPDLDDPYAHWRAQHRDPGSAHAFPLLPAPGTPPGNMTLLAVDAVNTPHAWLRPAMWDGQSVWVTSHPCLVFDGARSWSECDASAPLLDAAGQPLLRPRFVSDAAVEERPIYTNGSARLSLYAFDEAGLLVASNAPAFELDIWRLHGDYIPLSNAPWYFSNGTPPSGHLALPFGSQIARNALVGLPVGAVASVHIVEHPYAWYIGELWLTARIEALA